MFVDSHCHLDDPRFQEDFQDILKRAQAMKVQKLLTISTMLSTLPLLEKITAEYDWIYHSVGVHPNDVKDDGIPSVEALIKLCANPKAVALGETGLDYYYEHSDRQSQQKSFHHHIETSLVTGLPLIIHSRDAEEDIIKVLKTHALPRHPGVIHCFTGTAPFAEKALAMGFYISISGIITFKNADNLRAIVENVPLDRLLIETDSPYLAPLPHRGKRNEPSFVSHTAETVARLKNVPTQELGKITTKNFHTLFSKAS